MYRYAYCCSTVGHQSYFIKDSAAYSGNIKDFELAASVQPKIVNESDSGFKNDQPVIVSNIAPLLVRDKINGNLLFCYV